MQVRAAPRGSNAPHGNVWRARVLGWCRTLRAAEVALLVASVGAVTPRWQASPPAMGSRCIPGSMHGAASAGIGREEAHPGGGCWCRAGRCRSCSGEKFRSPCARAATAEIRQRRGTSLAMMRSLSRPSICAKEATAISNYSVTSVPPKPSRRGCGSSGARSPLCPALPPVRAVPPGPREVRGADDGDGSYGCRLSRRRSHAGTAAGRGLRITSASPTTDLRSFSSAPPVTT